MVDEYIRRKDAIRAFEADNQRLYYPFEVTNRLRTVPAADAAPVVRCKDCRYCYKVGEGTWCMNVWPAPPTTPEDYCSHGRINDG